MNARKSLSILVDALAELGGKAERSTLVNFVLGVETKDIKQKHLEGNELFGSGDERDDEHFNTVIDEAVRQKLMAQKSELVQATAKGKKLAKDENAEFIITCDDDDDDTATPGDNLSDEGLDLELEPVEPHQDALAEHTRLKIKLIQATDRKIALDEFAEQQNLDFNEVLDQVAALKKTGRKIDLGYFIQDVLEPEDIAELNESFENNNGDLQAVYDELGDVYRPEEIHLAYVQWLK